jgi:hypothetical protein
MHDHSNVDQTMTKLEVTLTVLALLLAITLSTEAWSSPMVGGGVSRRQCFEGGAIGAIGLALSPSIAVADVTNKVASPAALRSVKRAQKQLEDLKTVAQADDFTQVKAFLRTPPFSDVRKNCYVIVRGGDDGPNSEELQSTYKAFIASIEKIDSTASLGIRGRKIPAVQLSEEYRLVESSINDFVKVAEEATLSIGR